MARPYGAGPYSIGPYGSFGYVEAAAVGHASASSQPAGATRQVSLGTGTVTADAEARGAQPSMGVGAFAVSSAETLWYSRPNSVTRPYGMGLYGTDLYGASPYATGFYRHAAGAGSTTASAQAAATRQVSLGAETVAADSEARGVQPSTRADAFAISRVTASVQALWFSRADPSTRPYGAGPYGVGLYGAATEVYAAAVGKVSADVLTALAAAGAVANRTASARLGASAFASPDIVLGGWVRQTAADDPWTEQLVSEPRWRTQGTRPSRFYGVGRYGAGRYGAPAPEPGQEWYAQDPPTVGVWRGQAGRPTRLYGIGRYGIGGYGTLPAALVDEWNEV